MNIAIERADAGEPISRDSSISMERLPKISKTLEKSFEFVSIASTNSN